jgi:sugar lactone lactonase YvrE
VTTSRAPSLLALASLGALVLFVCACPLQGYDTRLVSCDPNGEACPDGFVCLDVEKRGRTVCVEEGCGDGIVNAGATPPEECDDANANELDACDGSCHAAAFVPDVGGSVGFGSGAAEPSKTRIDQPSALAVDRNGNVFVALLGDHVIKRYDANAQKLTPFAGNGTIVDLGVGAGLDAVAPNEMSAAFVFGLTVDGVGNLYVADEFENVIRRIDAVTGAATIVVETRPALPLLSQEPQAPTTSRPYGLATDGDGVLYFVDQDYEEAPQTPPIRRVRRLDPDTGLMETFFDGVVRVNGNTFITNVHDIDFDDSGRLFGFTGDSILIFEPPFTRAPTIVALPLASCPRPTSPQNKLAITRDGSVAFYPSGERIFRVNIPDGGGHAACEQIAALKTSSAQIPLLEEFSGPGAIDVAFLDEEQSLLVADPTYGVVWSIPADESFVASFDALLGSEAEIDSDALTSAIIEDMALQTDGRMTMSETLDCVPAGGDGLPRLAREHLELFGAFPDQHVLMTISCRDQIGAMAGSGVRGDDDGPIDPLRAKLNNPVAAVRSTDQNIYVADRDNDKIKEILTRDDDGNILEERVLLTYLGPDEPILGAPLSRPSGLAADNSGSLIISDSGNDRIIRVPANHAYVDADGNRVTPQPEVLVENAAGPSGVVFLPYAFAPELLALLPDEGAACNPPLGVPTLYEDPCGLLIFAERSGHRVRALSLEPLPRALFDLAGSPAAEAPAPGDHDVVVVDGKQRSELRFPRSLTVDIPTSASTAGGTDLDPNLLILDGVHRLRRLHVGEFTIFPPSFNTTLTTVTALNPDGVGFTSSDDAVDGSALLRGPSAIAPLDDRRVLVVERITGRLRLATLPSGEGKPIPVVTVAGLPEGTPVVGEVPAAEAVPLDAPTSVALDVTPDGERLAYVTEPALRRVRRFHLRAVADASTWTTDVLPVSTDSFVEPVGVAVDPEAGVLYVVDRGAHVVLRVPREGGIPDVVLGQRGLRGATDDGPAAATLLNAPERAIFVKHGDDPLLFVADSGNQRVRRVELATGDVTTVLGDGTAGTGGEGAPAHAFPVFSPLGMTTDSAGNLFVTSGSALRMVQSDTFARGSQPGVADANDEVVTVYGKAPRVRFPEAVTRCLADVAVAPTSAGTSTQLLVVDSCLGVIVRLNRTVTP